MLSPDQARICPHCGDPKGYRGDACPHCGKDDGVIVEKLGDSTFMCLGDLPVSPLIGTIRWSKPLGDVTLRDLLTGSGPLQLTASAASSGVKLVVDRSDGLSQIDRIALMEAAMQALLLISFENGLSGLEMSLDKCAPRWHTAVRHAVAATTKFAELMKKGPPSTDIDPT